ncbi:hypothetical protein PVAP13_8KG080300 [Panicum virgatum]|uniref:MINDY deubiquitinase domain-containing protein n=2 Tax=Panicum virgatum TaxID=38727 RepID=A0A8T0PJ02_PANVG|nr:hypothetical protein PVAP13_8KG080300 [Panicum virgatum]
MADTNMKYRLREIEFLGNRKHIIVLQDDAEWCPLVEISNIVLLRDEVPQGITICRTTNGEKYVRRVTLDHLLYTFMLRKIRLAVHKGLATEDQMNATLPVILANIRSLSTSFNVCPGGLKRTSDLEDGMEKQLYGSLGTQIYHGFLVDCQDADTSEAVGMKTYRQLLKEVEDLETSTSEGNIQRSTVIRNFSNSSKTQLTPYG